MKCKKCGVEIIEVLKKGKYHSNLGYGGGGDMICCCCHTKQEVPVLKEKCDLINCPNRKNLSARLGA